MEVERMPTAPYGVLSAESAHSPYIHHLASPSPEDHKQSFQGKFVEEQEVERDGKNMVEQNMDVEEEVEAPAQHENLTGMGERQHGMMETTHLQSPLVPEHDFDVMHTAENVQSSSALHMPDLELGKFPADLPTDLEDMTGLGSPLQSTFTGVEEGVFPESALSVVESEAPRIQAFAKLEFDDGQFYMNTYSVELGRDIHAARRAFRHDLEAQNVKRKPHHTKSDSAVALRQDETKTVASSAVSESGGIMNLEVQGEERPRRPRSTRPKSATSSSHGVSKKTSVQNTAPQTDYQSLAYASLNHGPRINQADLVPSHNECPLIPVHPPADGDQGISGHKGISRRHIKIFYNFDRRGFQLEVKGRNGAFVDDQFFEINEVTDLKSGSSIQIGGVSLRFILPDQPVADHDMDNLNSDAISHGAMSFDFEDGRGESVMADEDVISDSSDGADSRFREQEEQRAASREEIEESDEGDDHDSDDGEDKMKEIDDRVDLEDEAPRRRSARQPRPAPKMLKKSSKRQKPVTKQHVQKLKLTMKSKDEPSKTNGKRPTKDISPLKRKGPGRPPKNGIMSKREEAEIRRREKEAAKARTLGEQIVPRPGKSKTVPGSGQPVEEADKRTSVKRKREDSPQEAQPEEANDVMQSIESPEAETSNIDSQGNQANVVPKPLKEKRPPKPPRSPSPVWDVSTLTPEQLAKPTQSYVILIHEALSSSRTGQMSLPQIYRAIERRYPYYKLRVQTVGWQSSVRHNLSQHPAFVKIERDGKGWMWGLDNDISIEREKKRRPSPTPMPPPMYPPGMFIPGRPWQPDLPPISGAPPFNNMTHNPYAMFPHNPPPPHSFPSNLNNQHPNGAPLIPLPGVPPPAPAGATYQSPYTAGYNNSIGTSGQPLSGAQIGQARRLLPPHSPPYVPAPFVAPHNQPQQNPIHSRPNPNFLPPPPPQGQGQPPSQNQPPKLPQQLPAPYQSHASQPPSQMSPSPASSTSTGYPSWSTPHMTPQIQIAINRFRGQLISLLTKTTNAQLVVDQAISKCLGIRPPPGVVHEECEETKPVILNLKKILIKYRYPLPTDLDQPVRAAGEASDQGTQQEQSSRQSVGASGQSVISGKQRPGGAEMPSTPAVSGPPSATITQQIPAQPSQPDFAPVQMPTATPT